MPIVFATAFSSGVSAATEADAPLFSSAFTSSRRTTTGACSRNAASPSTVWVFAQLSAWCFVSLPSARPRSITAASSASFAAFERSASLASASASFAADSLPCSAPAFHACTTPAMADGSLFPVMPASALCISLSGATAAIASASLALSARPSDANRVFMVFLSAGDPGAFCPAAEAAAMHSVRLPTWSASPASTAFDPRNTPASSASTASGVIPRAAPTCSAKSCASVSTRSCRMASSSAVTFTCGLPSVLRFPTAMTSTRTPSSSSAFVSS